MQEEKPKSLEIVYTEIKSRLDKQSEEIDTLNQRASVLLGFVTLLMSLLAGFTTTVKVPDLPGDSLIPVLLTLIAAILYIHILIFAYLGYKIQTYRRDPEPRPLRDGYLIKNEETTKRQVISNFIDSYETNAKHISKKKNMLNKAYILFIIEAIYIITVAVGFFIYRLYAG